MSGPELELNTAAARALQAVTAELEAAGIPATADVGAFYPAPVGVLVGLPALASRTLAGATYDVRVLVVTGDPLNTLLAVDRLYGVADAVALALSIEAYAGSSWQAGPLLEPLPAVELHATVTVRLLEEVS